MLKHYYPDTKFHFVFTNPLTIGSFFRFKDTVPRDLTSNIIYDFTCPSCKARYIGETKRNLKYRIAEHKGISPRTNKPITNPSFSSIREHSHEHDHVFTSDDFRIIHKLDDHSDRKLLESIYIKYHKPELNTQLVSDRLRVL